MVARSALGRSRELTAFDKEVIEVAPALELGLDVLDGHTDHGPIYLGFNSVIWDLS